MISLQRVDFIPVTCRKGNNLYTTQQSKHSPSRSSRWGKELFHHALRKVVHSAILPCVPWGWPRWCLTSGLPLKFQSNPFIKVKQAVSLWALGAAWPRFGSSAPPPVVGCAVAQPHHQHFLRLTSVYMCPCTAPWLIPVSENWTTLLR